MTKKNRRTAPLTKVIEMELQMPNGHLIDISKARNWKYWQKFLEDEKSFRYERAGLSFTAVKEKRTGSKKWPLRGKNEIYVWYAHQRRNGKLRKRYLGYNETVTAEELNNITFKLDEGSYQLSEDGNKKLAHKAVNEHDWNDEPWLRSCKICNIPAIKDPYTRPSYLVAHHWNGYQQANRLNVWWICRVCNSYLPHDGSLTIEDAKGFMRGKI